MEQKEKEKNPEYFECKVCHLKFRNEMYFESHMVMDHQKKVSPSGVQ
jgi:hypothetical protein